MPITRTIVAIFATAFISLPALATTPSQYRLQRSEARDASQDSRIAAGLGAGQINPNEAARLDAQQARIDTGEARLAADGRYSRRDAARIGYRQDRASANIARARHNRR